MSGGHRDSAVLVRILGPGPDCIPIGRLDDALATTDRRHLDSCPRCQAELALWRAFSGSAPSSFEGGGVRWVVAELGRRLAPASRRAPAGTWRWLTVRRPWPVAAAVAVAAAVGYTAWDPEPRVRTLHGVAQVYRTASLDAIAPLGDVAAAPRAIEWASLSGAAVYDVEVFEVDRSTLWRGSSFAPRIELPPSLSVHFAPGKSVLWEVTARNGAGVVVAHSGAQRFRVAAPRPMQN